MAWQMGINDEAQKGHTMSAAFMDMFWNQGKQMLPPDRILRYSAGQLFTEKVRKDQDTRDKVLTIIEAEMKARKFDPCCFCRVAQQNGGTIRVPLPKGNKTASGNVTYMRNGDLAHAIHGATAVVTMANAFVEVSSVGSTCEWSIGPLTVQIMDMYDFVLGGAGPGAPGKLRFANDLGAMLMMTGRAKPFTFIFTFEDAYGGSCGLAPKGSRPIV